MWRRRFALTGAALVVACDGQAPSSPSAEDPACPGWLVASGAPVEPPEPTTYDLDEAEGPWCEDSSEEGLRRACAARFGDGGCPDLAGLVAALGWFDRPVPLEWALYGCLTSESRVPDRDVATWREPLPGGPPSQLRVWTAHFRRATRELIALEEEVTDAGPDDARICCGSTTVTRAVFDPTAGSIDASCAVVEPYGPEDFACASAPDCDHAGSRSARSRSP